MPGREKLYICSDVDLPEHPRVLACEDPGGCLGLWQAMTAYSRQHLTDGVVPKRYALGAFGDPARNGPRLADMVKHGLLSEEADTYTVLRYAPRNQTKAMVEESRAKARKRMQDKRAAKGAGEIGSGDVRANTTGTDGERGANDDGSIRVTVYEQPRDVPTSSSSSGSDHGSGEGVQGEVAPPRPVDGPLPRGVVLFERSTWVAAYERAVDATRRPKVSTRWTFQGKAFAALVAVVEKHCTGEDRKQIDRWIERTVTDFVRAIDGLGEDPKLWSSYGPDGLLRWFNENRKGYVPPRRGPVKPAAPAAPPEPPMSPEAAAAAAEAVRKKLGGIGLGGVTIGH